MIQVLVCISISETQSLDKQYVKCFINKLRICTYDKHLGHVLPLRNPVPRKGQDHQYNER